MVLVHVPMWRCRGELLGALLDSVEHLPFHHERAGLHRKHDDSRAERRESEAIATDQPRLTVTLIEHECPDPVAVL